MSTLLRRLIPVVVGLLLMTVAAPSPEAARQAIPSQRDIDALFRAVLGDLWTVNDFARRASVQVTASHYNVPADLQPMAGRLTAAALPAVPGVGFTPMTREEAAEIARRTGQRVYFIDVGLLSLTATDAALRLGDDFAAPPDPDIIKLCCCSRVAYYAKRNDRWTFRDWGAMRCS